MLAKLAWKREPSAEFEGAFVPGHSTTVQIMVKDSMKYESTGGWGFGRFIDGMAVDRAQHETCFACHQANVRNHDYVFTRLRNESRALFGAAARIANARERVFALERGV